MAKAKPIPEGFTTITPHLVVPDIAAAIDFYKRAFGAVELMSLPGPDGKPVHGELQIGNARLMLGCECPEWGSFSPKALKGSPVTIHLYVADVDAVMAQATQAGARVTMPAADQFWGDRYGNVEDPFGHRWGVATHLREPSMEEMMEAMKNMAPA